MGSVRQVRISFSVQNNVTSIHRCRSPFNTTMANERFHRTLKYTILNKSANWRLDKILNVLIKYPANMERDLSKNVSLFFLHSLFFFCLSHQFSSKHLITFRMPLE